MSSPYFSNSDSCVSSSSLNSNSFTSSSCSSNQYQTIINNLQSFLENKHIELSLEHYPDNYAEFGIETEWSHVEKINSEVYIVSECSFKDNHAISRVNTNHLIQEINN